jgi:hypothetical protein
MSVILSVPIQCVEKYELRPDIKAWLEDQCEYLFCFDFKYGPCIEIEDENVALQMKLIFDL